MTMIEHRQIPIEDGCLTYQALEIILKSVPHTFRKGPAKLYAHLDPLHYEKRSKELRALGFRVIADVINLKFNQLFPSHKTIFRILAHTQGISAVVAQVGETKGMALFSQYHDDKGICTESHFPFAPLMFCALGRLSVPAKGTTRELWKAHIKARKSAPYKGMRARRVSSYQDCPFVWAFGPPEKKPKTILSPAQQPSSEITTNKGKLNTPTWILQLPVLLPAVQRGESIEDPLNQILKSKKVGRVTGGGSLIANPKKLSISEIHIEVSDVNRMMGVLPTSLRRLRLPKGSKVIDATTRKALIHV